MNFVSEYCKKLSLSEKFRLDWKTKNCLYKKLKNIEVTKAIKIDQISGKSLKDGEVKFSQIY